VTYTGYRSRGGASIWHSHHFSLLEAKKEGAGKAAPSADTSLG
jgi:hypothetical protein